jgi:predicted nucleic acid-binding protein
MAVADASVWINLVATGCADKILKLYGGTLDITQTALSELERGRAKGRQAADEVAALLHLGLIKVVDLDPRDEDLFLSLVAGGAAQTLDDGEAATLVHANRFGTTALIDERKATSLAAVRFPSLSVASTVDLLFSPPVRRGLGEAGLGDALYGALVDAKMRVAVHRATEVIACIGSDRAEACSSLPASVRRALNSV